MRIVPVLQDLIRQGFDLYVQSIKSMKVTLTKVKNYIQEVLGSNPRKDNGKKEKKSQIMESNAIVLHARFGNTPRI